METISAPMGQHRNIPGGLDNAVDQAEVRDLRDLFIIDTDCHQAEPYTRFDEYLPDEYRQKFASGRLLDEAERFRDAYEAYAPDPTEPLNATKIAMLKAYDEMKGHWVSADNTMGNRIRRPEMAAPVKGVKYWEQKSEEIVDMFTKRMHDIGIARSMIFPNMMLEMGTHPDPMVEAAVDNAYIDYMLDEFLGKYPEIYTCVCVPAGLPDKAAELIDRVGKEKGICGVMISPVRKELAGDESWNPIYEAAVSKGLPICFHGGTNKLAPFDQFDQNNFLPIHALGFPWYLAQQATSLIVKGVPERFPGVKFVFMEAGVSWIPWLMDRLDTAFLMRRSEAPLLTKRPSEYMKKFFYTQQPLDRPVDRRDLEWVFRRFNAETQLVYASDYPHWDFDLPSCIYDLPFLTKEAKKRILSDNAKELFKIN